MRRALKKLEGGPNHIFVVPPSSTSNVKSKMQVWDHMGKGIYSNLLAVAAVVTLFLYALSPSAGGSGVGSRGDSGADVGSHLRFSFNGNKREDEPTNRFSFSPRHSPYEQIWVNSLLPGWAKKKVQFRDIEDTIPPEQRICFVHVGKAGGSSVGCALGFNLHCSNSTQPPLGGLLPVRATRMFHADTYDCHDDSAYFLFVVRNPLERLKSAFLYERPTSEAALKRQFPEYYERRKSLYLDCPSFGVFEQFVQDGLTSHGHANDVCKFRAATAVRGEQHFSCHMYFNYQFHLEGIPEGANILTIRNEHLVQDWNGVELYIGGVRDIIPPEKANVTIGVVNKSKKDGKDKELSEESTRIVCRQLCNEIVNYKKILRRSLNLNYLEVERSIGELRESCGKYADYEEGDCSYEMPNIKEKLISSRGYEHLVNEETYMANKNRLETMHHWVGEDSMIGANETMDDDAYDLPYSVRKR
ncbi:hypothetical protein ACHAXA_007142 [Cyclostephanos tholiformis]|uniref:Sulfotransferase n=1 Tax=Cyclostephanos tholiformis TaxID=382380 RepID=A0ABD3RUY5_9STRA